jgi:carotenoid cleavage dioxygenase-like enzyme
MQRRNFLQLASTCAGLAAAPVFAANAPAAPAPDAWTTDFDRAARRDAWLEAYRGVQHDIAPTRLALEGRWPADLRGVLYRNGAARSELPGLRYHHWFDGDGMLQRFEIGDRGVSHFGRFVRTDKFVAEEKAGRPLRPTFGTVFDGADDVPSPDAMNVANISVLLHHGELMALWEGGSATRIDPASLATLGTKTWRDDYAGMPFSAHPKVEPDGTLWNFGISSGAGMLSIYRIAANGDLLTATSMKIPRIAMVHDFAVTARHLVFLMPPLLFDVDRMRHGESFLDSHEWKPEVGMRALIVDKNDLSRMRWFELEAGMLFHIGNAWEDEARGVIHIDYMRSPDATLAQHTFRDLMRGRVTVTPEPQLTLAEFDLGSGRATQTVMPMAAEFPKIDPRRVGQRHRDLFAVTSAGRPNPRGFNAVMRVDMARGHIDRFHYGDGMLAEEHLFVPRRGGSAEGDGYLLGTVFDPRRQVTVLSVFDAQHLADGPLARAALDRGLPLGLHGFFAPA